MTIPTPSRNGSARSLSESASVAGLLAAQQRVLVERVARANMPGNPEGLFAYHVLHDAARFPLAWNVNPATPAWLAENAARLGQTPTLAALGYGLWHFRSTAPPSVAESLATGLAKLRLRDPFPDDRLSFAFEPVLLPGIALGCMALRDGGEEARAWLTAVLDDQRCQPSTPYHRLLYGYVRHLLTGDVATINDVRDYRDITALALLEWGKRRGAVRLVDPNIDASALQASILQEAVTADLFVLPAARAGLVWGAVDASLERSIHEAVLSRGHVGAILRRFQPAMRRWRWDDLASVKQPVQWAITSEREVQDLVWLILRSVFEDVVDEETLPKIGHSTYRADFGIPSLRLLVEVKYARKPSDFKKLEKEIMEDAVAYLLETEDRYERILVFIYDHSVSVQEHDQTANALRKLPQVEDVIIVSRPSQLPSTSP
jgi:hypothetical protein